MSKLNVMNYEERTSTDKYWYQRVKLLQAGILMKRLHSKKNGDPINSHKTF